MAYIAPKDYSQDTQILEKVMRTMAGELQLDWMQRIGERAAFRPSDPRRGLTLDDINQGAYSPSRLPEIIRHNFSMAPRGSILPDGLPSLGYRVNRKSDVWSDLAPSLYEESKSRRWAPAVHVPWEALDGRDPDDPRERAMRQISTNLIEVGLVCCDVPAFWVWRMNQEFHEIKYLMCAQMFDGARIVEAYRKRALYGSGSLGVDCIPLGEFLRMIFEADTFPKSSLAMNVLLFSWLQALGRQIEFCSDNAVDSFLGTRLAQDASRFLAYGVDHIRSLIGARPRMQEDLSEFLEPLENAWIGVLGSVEVIEPLILLCGGLEPVLRAYERSAGEYFARCAAAGLGDRRKISALDGFLEMLRA